MRENCQYLMIMTQDNRVFGIETGSFFLLIEHADG